MKKKNILLLLFGLMFSLGINSVLAIEVEEGWTLLEEGSLAVAVDKLEELEEKLAYRVNTMNKSDLDRIYRYKIESDRDDSVDNYLEISNNKSFENEDEALEWALENEPSNEGYSFVANIIKSFGVDKILELVSLETLEEANAKVDDFINYVDENSANTTISEVRDEADDVVVSVVNAYKFDTFDDAYNASLELVESNHDYVITVDVYEGNPEYVETDTIVISSIFDTREEAYNYVCLLEENGYMVEYEIQEINELSSLDITYETKESAEEALEEFLSLYPETVISNIEEIRDEAGDITVKVDNTYKFDSYEDAYNTSLELAENNHDYIVEISVYKGDSELVDTNTLTINKIFNNIEEANNYISSLKNDGYVVEVSIVEVDEVTTLNQVYDTYEEAEEALALFKEDLKEFNNSNIIEERDTTEDNIITNKGVVEYSTYEEALDEVNTLNENTDVYQVVASVREETKNIVTGPSNVESDQFDTYEEAINYIAELEKAGYDVSNLKIELVPFEESIWGDDEDVEVNPGEDDDTKFTYNHFDVTLITNFTKIDSLGNQSTITGNIAISEVKIANKTIAMTGPSRDPNGGYIEYASRDRFRLNVTEDSLVEISGSVTYFDSVTNKEKTLPFTVSGYLSESQNVCGGKGNSKGFDLEFESVTIINNRVVIDTNIVSKYKVVGTIVKNEVQTVYYVDTIKTVYGFDYSVDASGTKLVGYQVNGSAVKNTYKDVYLLDINKTTLDYDYRVVADGIKFIGYQVNGSASKDIYKDVYLLDINKTMLDYDYEVSGTGIKTYYDVISSYVRLTNVEYIIEYMELGKGGDVEELPPQTGVNVNTSLFNSITILVIGLILVIKKTLA